MKITISSGGGESFQWIGPELIKLPGNAILDLNLKTKIGEIRLDTGVGGSRRLLDGDTILYLKAPGAKSTSVFGGGADGQQTRLGIAKLPIAQIESHRNRLSKEDLVVLQRGDQVKLTMDLGGNPSLENQILQKVSDDLSKGGVSLGNDTPFALHLAYRVGEPVAEKYNIIGLGIKERSVTRTPKSCSAKLIYDGQTVWSSGRSVGAHSPRDEQDLNSMLSEEKSFSASQLLEIQYPAHFEPCPHQKSRTSAGNRP